MSSLLVSLNSMDGKAQILRRVTNQPGEYSYRPLEKSEEIRSAVATISFRTDSR